MFTLEGFTGWTYNINDSKHKEKPGLSHIKNAKSSLFMAGNEVKLESVEVETIRYGVINEQQSKQHQTKNNSRHNKNISYAEIQNINDVTKYIAYMN